MSAPHVYKTWPDGYIVRRMEPKDVPTVQKWYSEMTPTARDLNIALDVYGPDAGFYIGELAGEVVASAVRLPVTSDVYYGSYFYVSPAQRGRGLGTRLRDEVGEARIDGNMLCIDAHEELQAMNERRGYKRAFDVVRFHGVAPARDNLDSLVLKWKGESLKKIIDYDDKCFVRSGVESRHKLLERWCTISEGATFYALDSSSTVIGYGCRRPTFTQGHHLIGPLYADSRAIAERLFRALCADVAGSNVYLDVCMLNEAAISLVKEAAMTDTLHMIRMHLNGNPEEYNSHVYGLTSIDICGF